MFVLATAYKAILPGLILLTPQTRDNNSASSSPLSNALTLNLNISATCSVTCVIAYYPAGIILFSTLGQFLLSIPGDEGSPALVTSEADKAHSHTENYNISLRQQRDSQALPHDLILKARTL